jgi:RNA recognition motif. (a.k.a. RRM, RBD, or RNP domain)
VLNKLIISNLPEDITEDELAEGLHEYGLQRTILKPGKYAVLIFEDGWGAAKAKSALGEPCLWGGRWVRIKLAD